MRMDLSFKSAIRIFHLQEYISYMAVAGWRQTRRRPYNAGMSESPESPSPPRRKRKRFRYILVATGLLVGAVVATPFVFTTTLLRYYLAHSPYRDLPLTFGKASLSP